jgi:predicted nucleic acid-binding protein
MRGGKTNLPTSIDFGASPRVVIDSCVWHSAFVRHALRHLALAELLELRWTELIEQEWIRSVRSVRPNIALSDLEQARDRFRLEFPSGLVTPKTSTPVPAHLPDPSDAHVIRAAVSCGAPLICTVDRKGFPSHLLRPIGITAITPDELMLRLLRAHPKASVAAIETHRIALTAPPLTRHEYAISLRRCGLPASAAQLTTEPAWDC